MCAVPFILLPVDPASTAMPAAAQTLVSLWSVCERQLGQNFLIENFSVCFFLFFVVL
jgi:hypothetical protein